MGVRGMTPKDDFVGGLALSSTDDRLYLGGHSDGLPGSDNQDVFVSTLNPTTGLGIAPFPIFQKGGQKPGDDKDTLVDIAVGPQSDAVFIAGHTASRDFFKPLPPFLPFPNKGASNSAAFIARLNGNGGVSWSHQLNDTYLPDKSYFLPYTVEKLVTSVEFGQEYVYALVRSPSIFGTVVNIGWIMKYNANTGDIIRTYTPWLDATRYKLSDTCRVKIPDEPTCNVYITDFTVAKTGELYLTTTVDVWAFILGYKDTGLFNFAYPLPKRGGVAWDARIATSYKGEASTPSLYIFNQNSLLNPKPTLSRFSIQPNTITPVCSQGIEDSTTNTIEVNMDQLVADTQGNAYVGGRVNGDFGRIGSKDREPVVAKYDASCRLKWVYQWEVPPFTTEDLSPVDMAVDSIGNLFVTGRVSGSSSFGGASSGKTDFWLNKIDGTTGKLTW